MQSLVHPFVLVTAKCKMGGGKSATFRERRRARETNGKRRRHLSASKGPQVVAWISSRAFFCISQPQQTNGKRRRHLGASPCTSFLTVAFLDFARLLIQEYVQCFHWIKILKNFSVKQSQIVLIIRPLFANTEQVLPGSCLVMSPHL